MHILRKVLETSNVHNEPRSRCDWPQMSRQIVSELRLESDEKDQAHFTVRVYSSWSRTSTRSMVYKGHLIRANYETRLFRDFLRAMSRFLEMLKGHLKWQFARVILQHVVLEPVIRSFTEHDIWVEVILSYEPLPKVMRQVRTKGHLRARTSLF